MARKDREGSNYSKLKRVNRYYLKTGLYKLILKNLGIVLSIIAILVLAVWIIDTFFMDFGPFLEKNLEKLNPVSVFIFFFFSETILGLIPPDIFIIWTETLFYPLPNLAILSVLSYLGGVTAYLIGLRIRKIPRVYEIIHKRFYKQERFVKKWGGFFIIVSALLPFPFAIVCTVCGMTKYPFQRLLLFGLARIARFFLYSLFLYKMFSFAI